MSQKKCLKIACTCEKIKKISSLSGNSSSGKESEKKVENTYKIKVGREKGLKIKCTELCKVLSPTRFNQIEKKHRKITAQGILIANVQDLKIWSHYKSLDCMMEKGFFDSHREKEE